MFRRQRPLIGLLLPLVLVGATIFVSNVFAQKAKTETFVYTPPTLSVTADQSVLSTCAGEGGAALIRLNAQAISPDGNPIRYIWTTNAGRIEGDGAAVTWNLSGVKAGYYKAYLEIDTGSGDRLCQAFSSTAVLVKCPPPPPPICPNVSITCPEKVEAGQPVIFSSTLSGGTGNIAPMYNWNVSAGKITAGQGTSSITVDSTGLAGQTLTATLSMGGYNQGCSATCTVQFPIPLNCRRFDEFPALARNDEKARLDNFAIELQNDPASTAYVIVYPGQRGRAGAVQSHTSRIVDYLVNSRGVDSGRIVTLVGPARPELLVDLWICPQGAAAPTP
jgi:hypothetical protein